MRLLKWLISVLLFAAPLSSAGAQTQAPLPIQALPPGFERAAEEAPFRRVADEFIAAAAAGDMVKTAQMISPEMSAKTGREGVERYLAGQVIPFFSQFKEIAKSVTVAPTADLPGFGYYMYMVSKTDEFRPFVIYVVEEGGAKVVFNIVVDHFVESRHCARVSGGWKCPDFQ
jgi:hypothetical protein